MLRRLVAAWIALALAAAPLGVAAQGNSSHDHGGGGWGGGGWGGGGGGHWGGGGFTRGGFDGPRQGGYAGPHGYESRGGPHGYDGRPGRDFDPRPRGERDYPGERERGGYGRGPEMSERVFGGQVGRGGGRWMRGQHLPPEARGAVVEDFGRFHLRRPPRGYYWYRAGDDYVMASTANGMIFEVIPADPY